MRGRYDSPRAGRRCSQRPQPATPIDLRHRMERSNWRRNGALLPTASIGRIPRVCATSTIERSPFRPQTRSLVRRIRSPPVNLNLHANFQFFGWYPQRKTHIQCYSVSAHFPRIWGPNLGPKENLARWPRRVRPACTFHSAVTRAPPCGDPCAMPTIREAR